MENTSNVARERHFAASHTSIALALATLMTGCGGGGSDGASTASTGTGAGTGTVTTLFEQPQESGIAGNVVVPLAVKSSPPQGTFILDVEQPDPFTTNGELVTTAWNASSQTGFAPSDPASDQLGFQNTTGTSTAQMDGDTVGAYINSKDLPTSTIVPGGAGDGCGGTTSSPVETMMIAPQYAWAAGAQPVPFASSSSVLNGSMNLQVPVASGVAYVDLDLLFEDSNGLRISYGIKLFANGITKPALGCGYNAPANSFRIDSPLGIDQQYVTNAAGSGSDTAVPWLGWQYFAWSISQSQFTAALQYLSTQFPGKVEDVDPAHYMLIQVHLNAELNFLPGPAELGWSMSGLKIWVAN